MDEIKTEYHTIFRVSEEFREVAILRPDGTLITRLLSADIPNVIALLLKHFPPSDGWVSVKDRQPEKSGDYLVTKISDFSGHEGERYAEDRIRYEAEFEPQWMTRHKVIAWRPMIEPYAGE